MFGGGFCVFKEVFFIQSFLLGIRYNTEDLRPNKYKLDRGQRSKVTGLKCNDPSTAGHSVLRNVTHSAVWPFCYSPCPPLC